jgi:hypothetical protein
MTIYLNGKKYGSLLDAIPEYEFKPNQRVYIESLHEKLTPFTNQIIEHGGHLVFDIDHENNTLVVRPVNLPQDLSTAIDQALFRQ